MQITSLAAFAAVPIKRCFSVVVTQTFRTSGFYFTIREISSKFAKFPTMPAAEGHQPGLTKETAPCRTCTDFKSWSKQQRQALSTSAKPPPPSELTTTPHKPAAAAAESKPSGPPKDCPLDKERLGRYTWGLLHTMAAYFPDNPTTEEQSNVRQFFTVFSKVYPCEYCATDFQQELKASPPETKSQYALSQWLCRMHNKVNAKLGKPEFDCSKVNERWRDGPADGSCD